jgi:F420-dependent oxidoreductase-like protein
MIEGQEDVTWEQWVALARACEEHGLEGLFSSDHFVSVTGRAERGSLDTWTTIAALSTVTERIRLGTLVSPVTFRHPTILAKSAVTADHISGGRVELGIGAGWHVEEHEAYGFEFPPADVRMSMLEEQAEIVHGLWSEQVFTFDGRHYRLDDVRALPKPVQDPHPPLIVGGHGGVWSARIAARWADEYNVYSRTPDQCRALRASVAEAWEREGRDPATLRFSLMTGVVIGEDRDEVHRRAAAVIKRSNEDAEPEAWIRDDDALVAGTVDEVVGKLQDLEAAGVDRVMLQHLVHEDLDTVALLGRQVAPAVA